MKRALYIALNEVKLYLQDKGDLAFSLLLPIVTFALIYAAFGGDVLFEGTAYVVDEDRSTYSEGGGFFRPTCKQVPASSSRKASEE